MAANSKDFRPSTENWLVCHSPRPAANLQLFCFPHAGSGAAYYRPWSQGLPENIEVHAIQLPGRENRMREPPQTDLRKMVRELADPIQRAARPPYAYYGHSMGALLAFELARYQTAADRTLPCHLFVSGRSAPQFGDHGPSEPRRHLLSDAKFLDELRRMQGTPAEILDNRELMEALLPAIRADFSVVENYVFEEGPRLDIPFHVFGGSEDHFTTRAGLEAWTQLSSAAVQIRVLPGDHFFVATQRRDLLRSIARVLGRYGA